MVLAKTRIFPKRGKNMSGAKRDKQVDIIKKAGAAWPGEIIARKQIGIFTGGMLSPRTLANLDSMGIGPHGVVRIGNAVGYWKDSLIDWLIGRIK